MRVSISSSAAGAGAGAGADFLPGAMAVMRRGAAEWRSRLVRYPPESDSQQTQQQPVP